MLYCFPIWHFFAVYFPQCYHVAHRDVSFFPILVLLFMSSSLSVLHIFSHIFVRGCVILLGCSHRRVINQNFLNILSLFNFPSVCCFSMLFYHRIFRFFLIHHIHMVKHVWRNDAAIILYKYQQKLYGLMKSEKKI
jgi:hypothetical protein